MAEERKDPFVPMVNQEGRVTGIMDRMTADYFASTDPDPTQAALDAVFARATRARLVGHRIDENNVYQFDVVRLEVSDPKNLAELRESLRILEDPRSFGHVMTIESLRLELWVGEQRLASIGIIGLSTLRWASVWKHDARLADIERFHLWLEGHGLFNVRQHREAAERLALEQRQRIERWEQAMPASLRPLWPEHLGGRDGGKTPDVAAARTALAAAVPDPIEQVRALFEWFGSGAGPWSGFPAYESAAEQLLMEYPPEVLARALEPGSSTEVRLLGAARLFGGWTFRQKRKADLVHCSPALRERMCGCVERQGIADNVTRFRHAFGSLK